MNPNPKPICSFLSLRLSTFSGVKIKKGKLEYCFAFIKTFYAANLLFEVDMR